MTPRSRSFGLLWTALAALAVAGCTGGGNSGDGGLSDAAPTGSNGTESARPAPADIDPLTLEQFHEVLDAHQGRVTLVNLWATWCAPCLREIPELLELEHDYGDRGLSLIAISLDDADATETIREFRDEWFPTLRTYHNATQDWYQLIAALEPNWSGILPTSFLIDRDGNLVATITGGKDYAAFEAEIAPLL